MKLLKTILLKIKLRYARHMYSVYSKKIKKLQFSHVYDSYDYESFFDYEDTRDTLISKKKLYQKLMFKYTSDIKALNSSLNI